MIDIISWPQTNAHYRLSLIVMPDIPIETEIEDIPSLLYHAFLKIDQKLAIKIFLPQKIKELDLVISLETNDLLFDRETYNLLSHHLKQFLLQLSNLFNNLENLKTFRMTLEMPETNFITRWYSEPSLSSNLNNFFKQIARAPLSHLELRLRYTCHHDDLLFSEALANLIQAKNYHHCEFHRIEQDSEYFCKRIDGLLEQSLESRIVLSPSSIETLRAIEIDWNDFIRYQSKSYRSPPSSIKMNFIIKGCHFNTLTLPAYSAHHHHLLKTTLAWISERYWQWIRSHITTKLSLFHSVWQVSGREVKLALHDNPYYLKACVDCILALPAHAMRDFLWTTSQIMRNYEPKSDSGEIITKYNIDLALFRFFSNITSSLVSLGINVLGDSKYFTMRECSTLLNERAPYLKNLGIKIKDSFPDCNETEDIKSKYLALKRIGNLRFLEYLCLFYQGNKYTVSPQYHKFQGQGWQKILRKWNTLTQLKELVIHADLYQHFKKQDRICSRTIHFDPIDIFCQSFSKTKIPVLSLAIRSMDFDGEYHLGPKIFYKNFKQFASRIAKNPYVYSLIIPRNGFSADPPPSHIEQLPLEIARTTEKNFFFRNGIRSLMKCLSFDRPNIYCLESVLKRHADAARQYALEYGILCFHYFRLYYTQFWLKLTHYILGHATRSRKSALESPLQYHLAKSHDQITSLAEWLNEEDCALLLFAADKRAVSSYLSRQTLGCHGKKYRLKTYNS